MPKDIGFTAEIDQAGDEAGDQHPAIVAHKAARKRFLDILNRWSRSTGQAIRIRCCQDVTNARNAHDDYVLYCPESLGVERIRDLIAEAWRRAGGLRSSCRLIDQADDDQADDQADDDQADELAAWSTYLVKARKADQRATNARAFQSIPVHGGLDITWGSGGFFAGHTPDGLWAEWRAETFPKLKVVELASPGRITISTKVVRPPDPEPTPSDPEPDPVILAWRAKLGAATAATRIQYHEGSRYDDWADDLATRYPDRVSVVTLGPPAYTPPDDSIELRCALPTTPDRAVSIPELADHLGWDERDVWRVLQAIPGVQRLDNWLDPQTGFFVSGAYHLPPAGEQAAPPDAQPARPADDPIPPELFLIDLFRELERAG